MTTETTLLDGFKIEAIRIGDISQLPANAIHIGYDDECQNEIYQNSDYYYIY